MGNRSKMFLQSGAILEYPIAFMTFTVRLLVSSNTVNLMSEMLFQRLLGFKVSIAVTAMELIHMDWRFKMLPESVTTVKIAFAILTVAMTSLFLVSG